MVLYYIESVSNEIASKTIVKREVDDEFISFDERMEENYARGQEILKGNLNTKENSK